MYPIEKHDIYNQKTMEVLAETEQLEIQSKLSPKTLSLDEYFNKVREQEKENIHSFMNQFTPLMEKLKDR